MSCCFFSSSLSLFLCFFALFSFFISCFSVSLAVTHHQQAGFQDAQALIHHSFYSNDAGFTPAAVNPADPAELQPRAYDQLEDLYGWQMVNKTLGPTLVAPQD